MTITFPDSVNVVYDRLDTFTWTTNYTAKPQLIRERLKGINRPAYTQAPGTGSIHISEVSTNHKRADGPYSTIDYTAVVRCKCNSSSTDRTETIYSGMMAAMWTYRKDPTPASGTAFHTWEFLRDSGLVESMNGYSRMVDFELKLWSQTPVP